MGAAYYTYVVQWCKADYACPTAVGQDDIAVIGRTLAPVGSGPNTSAGPAMLIFATVTGSSGQTVAGVLARASSTASTHRRLGRSPSALRCARRRPLPLLAPRVPTAARTLARAYACCAPSP